MAGSPPSLRDLNLHTTSSIPAHLVCLVASVPKAPNLPPETKLSLGGHFPRRFINDQSAFHAVFQSIGILQLQVLVQMLVQMLVLLVQTRLEFVSFSWQI